MAIENGTQGNLFGQEQEKPHGSSITAIRNQERKKQRICVRCIKPLDREGSRCSKCCALRREKLKYKAANGYCASCERPKSEEDMKYKCCASCRVKRNKVTQRWRKDRRVARECTNCGKPAAEGFKHCEKCLETHREREKKKPKKPKFCRRCGDGPLPPRRYVCDTCFRNNLNAAAKRTREKAIADGKCPVCGEERDTHRTLCSNCVQRERGKRLEVKRKVMNAYGGKCQCCDVDELAFLTLDHINNDGGEKRTSGLYPGGGSGNGFYRWVIRNNYPSDLQCLCFNCQWGKRLYGVCPHQQKKT